MSKTRNILIGLAGASLFLASAASVLAQPPQGQPGAVARGPGGPGGRGGPDGPGGPRDPERRAERLHQQLGITTGQEAAFQAFVAATSPDGPPPVDMQNMTTPQRLERQLAELQGRIAATNRLYGSLTAEQKAAFDALPPQVTMGGGPGRGGRDGPGRFAQGGPDGQGGPGAPGGRQGGRGRGGAGAPGGDYVPQ